MYLFSELSTAVTQKVRGNLMESILFYAVDPKDWPGRLCGFETDAFTFWAILLSHFFSFESRATGQPELHTNVYRKLLADTLQNMLY